jgi:hypothetical protein
VCGDSVRQDCLPFSPDDCDADGYPAPEDCVDDPAVSPFARDVNPGVPDELCNGVDDDCDGLTDGQEVTDPTDWPDWYVDLDQDGYGGDTPGAHDVVQPAAVHRAQLGRLRRHQRLRVPRRAGDV